MVSVDTASLSDIAVLQESGFTPSFDLSLVRPGHRGLSFWLMCPAAGHAPSGRNPAPQRLRGNLSPHMGFVKKKSTTYSGLVGRTNKILWKTCGDHRGFLEPNSSFTHLPPLTAFPLLGCCEAARRQPGGTGFPPDDPLRGLIARKVWRRTESPSGGIKH